MTEQNDETDASLPDATPSDAGDADAGSARRPGERLAKAIARAGLGSRREAEAWIEQGRVAVNGETVSAAAFNVTAQDRVEVDGRPLPARERTRLWLYHKPRGYVTTTHDPEGRETVFSILPPELPRVMTIGRLDINTEGLLLLTNDGGLARLLELPETGWLRRYRVRAFGRTTPEALAALRDGVTIDDFAYGPIEAEVERQQADNVWLRVGLREGKNREVKRVAEHLGLSVNRLIRISFGPFQLGYLGEGEVEEVRTRTLVDQIGGRLADEAGCDFEAPVFDMGEGAPRKTGGAGRGGASRGVEGRGVAARGGEGRSGDGRGGEGRGERAGPERRGMLDPSQRVGRRAPIARPRDMAAPVAGDVVEEAPKRTKRGGAVADRKGRAVKVERVARTAAEREAAPKRFRKKEEGAAERFGAASRPAGPARPPRDDKPRDARPPRREAFGGEERPSGPRGPRRDAPVGDRPMRRGPPRERDEARGEGRGEGRGERPARAAFGDRPERGAFGDRPKPRFREDGAPDRGPRSDRPRVDRPRDDRPRSDRPRDDRPRDDRPRDDRPRDDRPSADRPRDDRPSGERRAASAPRWRDDAATSGEARPRPPRGDRPDRGPRPDRPRREEDGARQDRPRGPRPGALRPGAPRGDRPERFGGDDRPARPPRTDRPRGDRPAGAAPRERSFEDREPARSGPRPEGDRKPFGSRSEGDRKGSGRPAAGGGRSGPGGKPGGGKPGGKPFGGKPAGGKPGGFKPRGGPGGGGGKGRPGGADRRR